ncbi:hypothetical protein ISN45_Aa03g014030 [Arabidopsis thaliana x Arabidopsis arenosa]|uniref:Uncharacterized protein n=1 Tax=Arabidopsis thaliana x Arabidopsis arenosa TaxID=1240361 RepID=A0A8T2AT24_9BRAS|nr:hypothetical protein ISN45_Aa03g014030 [Arabidopsis thaliana x Arabidopsis arenosa]
MVFSSTAMATVANVSTEKWQRMRRVPSSEILNTQQLMEVACCLPLSHLFICLWEFLCFSISDYDSDDDYDDDDVDEDDVLAFDHNSNGDYDDHGSSSSSNLDFDDYYHYPDSD